VFNDLIEPSRRNINIQIPLANTNGEPINVELLEGQLPPGLSLSASGLIYGSAAPVLFDTLYKFRLKVASKGAIEYRSPLFEIIIKSKPRGILSFRLLAGETYYLSQLVSLGETQSSDNFKFLSVGNNSEFHMIDPSDKDTYVYQLEDGDTTMISTRRGETHSTIVYSGNEDNALLQIVINDSLVEYAKITKMNHVLEGDFLGKSIIISSGCDNGTDAIYTIDTSGNWHNSCGHNGRIFLTTSTEFCEHYQWGYRLNMGNVMCFRNSTLDTSALIALRSGSFSTGGVLQFIGHDDEIPRQWTRNFTTP
jgi:hypothetical protein